MHLQYTHKQNYYCVVTRCQLSGVKLLLQLRNSMVECGYLSGFGVSLTGIISPYNCNKINDYKKCATI